jgi:hypothetical protein
MRRNAALKDAKTAPPIRRGPHRTTTIVKTIDLHCKENRGKMLPILPQMAIIAGMETVGSILFDNPKYKVRVCLSAKTATLLWCVISPGLFCLVEAVVK